MSMSMDRWITEWGVMSGACGCKRGKKGSSGEAMEQ
mgnify:CR=1 FL=1